MPTYVYKCDECDINRSFDCSISNKPSLKPKCRACNNDMRQVFQPLNFSISNKPYDYGKSMDAEKEQRIALERTEG